MTDAEEIRSALPRTHEYITGSYGEHTLRDYDEVGDELRGPHPVHGSDNWPDGQGNFSVNTKTGNWFCFRQGHKEGGNLFEWIAVDEGFVDCGRHTDLTRVYPDVLRAAANEAGIEYDPNPEERREKKRLYEKIETLENIFRDATAYYHQNLPDRIRQLIKDNYGLSDQTIDTVQLGWASPDETELKRALDYNEVELLESGLVLETPQGIQDFYAGRIIIPYWAHGKPKYFIGRKTPDTPDESWEGGKYKKLLTNDSKDHVSELVDEPIFGRDSAVGAERVVVTEGVTDVLAAWEAGYPCVSPVTTSFKKARVMEAADLLNGKEVLVVMDEDPDSEAGLEGAAKTVRALKRNTGPATEVGMWRLAEDGVEDGDLCDYLYEYPPKHDSIVADVAGISEVNDA